MFHESLDWFFFSSFSWTHLCYSNPASSYPKIKVKKFLDCRLNSSFVFPPQSFWPADKALKCKRCVTFRDFSASFHLFFGVNPSQRIFIHVFTLSLHSNAVTSWSVLVVQSLMLQQLPARTRWKLFALTNQFGLFNPEDTKSKLWRGEKNHSLISW